jgi:hypothetical protein
MTAVEWVIQELRGTDDKGDFIFQGVINSELIEQALEMEKQKIEKMYSEEKLRQAFRDGQSNMHYSDNYGLDSSLTEQQWFEQFKK